MAVVGNNKACVWIQFNNGYTVSFYDIQFNFLRWEQQVTQVKVNINKDGIDYTAEFFGDSVPLDCFNPIERKAVIEAEEIPLLLNELAKRRGNNYE